MAEARIFISHSSHDRAFALRIAAKLRQPGLSAWIDSEQIFTGDDILDELGRGLTTMDLLVLLASRHSLDSEWVNREVKHAQIREIEEKKALILVYILDETPPKGITMVPPPQKCGANTSKRRWRTTDRFRHPQIARPQAVPTTITK